MKILSRNEDFEDVAWFHNWVKENAKKIGLKSRDRMPKSIQSFFIFYCL